MNAHALSVIETATKEEIKKMLLVFKNDGKTFDEMRAFVKMFIHNELAQLSNKHNLVMGNTPKGEVTTRQKLKKTYDQLVKILNEIRISSFVDIQLMELSNGKNEKQAA